MMILQQKKDAKYQTDSIRFTKIPFALKQNKYLCKV